MNAWWIRYLPDIIREWLNGRQQLQKTIGNTGWLLFDRIVRLAGGVIISAWVARYLGPSQFGALAFVISFVAFFQVIASLEADGFVVRDIAQGQGEPHVILGTTLWLRLAFGTCSWLLATAMMFTLHPRDHQLVMLTVIIGASMVFQASDTVDLWFQSQSQSRRTVVAKLVAYLFSNGVRVVLLLCKAPLIAFAGVICLDCAVSALGLVIAYRNYPANGRWEASLGHAKVLLKQCWPFMFSGFMITVFMRVDQIMLKEIIGEKELGIFVAAITLSNLWAVLPGIVVTSLAPYVARKIVEGEEPYREAMATIFRFFAVAAFSGAVVTSAASSWIINVLYGDQYQLSAVVLKIHVFTNVFIFIGMAQHLWMVNKNANFVTMICTLLSAVIGITSNAILIRQFGILGAVYTYLLVQALSVVIIPCILRKDLLDIYVRAFFPWRTART